MDQSEPMKDFASSLVAKTTTSSSPKSSLLRNYSDVSLVDMGDDKCFALTKALGYHVIYGWFHVFSFRKCGSKDPASYLYVVVLGLDLSCNNSVVAYSNRDFEMRYEATGVGSTSIVGSYLPLTEMSLKRWLL